MKKVLGVMAVSAFVLTAGAAFAGGPGKQGVGATALPAGCPEECQQQIDELQGSQAQQDERLAAHAQEIEALKQREDVYNPWYVRGAFKLGWGSQKDYLSRDMDNELGYGGQAAVGKLFNSDFGDFRLELEYAYQKADLDDMDGDVSLQTFMVNGYYDLPVTEMFGIYFTVGAGYGDYNLNAGIVETPNGFVNYVNHNNGVFAYKGGAGVTFNFTDQLAMDLGYEYLGTSDAEINNAEFTSIRNHNIVTSLRFMF
ncbi:MAG: outer membrane beta-barrel protein [Desulfobulbus sp.]|jgi:opacity protein-like surface antigen